MPSTIFIHLLPLKLQEHYSLPKMKSHYDEEGSYKPPDASAFPSMSRRDCMMNVRIPPLGIEPPPFGEEQIREVN